MPSTVYRGTDSSITSGPTELNIHNWTAWVEEPQFDVQAETEVARTTVAGDPIGKMVILGSANGNTIPTPGDTISPTMKTNSGGGAITNNWRCTSVKWQLEKRGGGPPQMLHTEWVTTDTTLTGILAT